MACDGGGGGREQNPTSASSPHCALTPKVSSTDGLLVGSALLSMLPALALQPLL